MTETHSAGEQGDEQPEKPSEAEELLRQFMRVMAMGGKGTFFQIHQASRELRIASTRPGGEHLHQLAIQLDSSAQRLGLLAREAAGVLGDEVPEAALFAPDEIPTQKPAPKVAPKPEEPIEVERLF